jgi:hypothetical protein
MPALSFAPALSLLAAIQRVSPVRPLRTFMRAAEERFRPQTLARHEPATRPAEQALLGRAGAGLHQRATILREAGRGRLPTIVLGGFVPDPSEQVFLLRRMLLRHGDVYYFNYSPQGFSTELACAQLDDLVSELVANGQLPVVFSVSFGGGLALDWLRRTRLAGREAPLAGLVVVSPVTCADDVVAPGAGKPATLLGRALKPFLGGGEVAESTVEKSRTIFLRMFESGARNKTALSILMTSEEFTRLRGAVMGTIGRITQGGACERVRAMAAMLPPPAYFSNAVLPLTTAPALVLFAENEDGVLDPGSPARFALQTAHRAYFRNGRVQQVAALPGSPPVQHASLIFHVFEFLPHLADFYGKLRHSRMRSAA